MALIREDKYSPYVKVGGYVARPVRTEFQCPLFEEGTKYCAGDKVKARHIGGTCLVRVADEFWATHGSYYDTANDEIRLKHSTECWTPVS